MLRPIGTIFHEYSSTYKIEAGLWEEVEHVLDYMTKYTLKVVAHKRIHENEWFDKDEMREVVEEHEPPKRVSSYYE